MLAILKHKHTSTKIRESSSDERVVEKYRPRKPTGYVHDVRMMGHAPISDHPEVPQRLSHIISHLAERDIIQNMVEIEAREVTRDEALLVHSEDHWNKVEAIQCKHSSTVPPK
jgi:acetoin utilization deacetylase AcuC-like enzyme